MRRPSGVVVREWVEGWLFFSPWLLGFVAFVAFPMAYSVYLVFLDWNLLSPPEWVGLGNLARLVEDELFWVSLYDTAYYTFLGVPLQILVALLLALALNQPLRAVRLYRTVFYLPSVTPAVALAIVWLELLNPSFGLVNKLFALLALPEQKWLLFPASARAVFVGMSLWHVGGQMIIFLAGLQGVPQSLYEAASVDGAGPWHRFWHITIPMLSPSFFFNLTMGIIGSFQVFTTAFVMTNGGPENATLFMVLYIYHNAFRAFRMGYAATLAWVLFAIIAVFTLLQFRLARRWVYYEAGEG